MWPISLFIMTKYTKYYQTLKKNDLKFIPIPDIHDYAAVVLDVKISLKIIATKNIHIRDNIMSHVWPVECSIIFGILWKFVLTGLLE